MATYKPLFMYVSPASVPQIVAHIQKYLADNPIVSNPEAIAEVIQQYIEDHPEIIAVASVNGKTGNVVLTGSDININASSAVTIETQLLNLASMIASAGSNISQIQAQLETIYTNISTLDGKVTANETAIDSLETTVSGHGTRLATAESDIDSLETSQTAQGTRLNTAEGNISSLQTRMTQAETDIDNSENAISAIKTDMMYFMNCPIIYPSSFSIDPHSSMRFDVDISQIPSNAAILARIWGYSGSLNCVIIHTYSSYAYIYNLSDTAVTSLQAASIYILYKVRI